MKKTLIMPREKWEFLRPLLEQYVVEPENDLDLSTPIDYKEIASMKNGVRLVNILRDGRWGSENTQDGVSHNGTPYYIIRTIGELLRIKKDDFCKHRNAGQGAWDTLQEYISNI